MKTVYTWATDTAGVLYNSTTIPYEAADRSRFDLRVGGEPGAPDWAEADTVIGMRLADYQPTWEAICNDDNTYAAYFIDDNLLAVDPENSLPYSIYAPIVEQTKRNMVIADVVIVPNAMFANEFEQYNKNIVIIPVCTPDWLFDLPLKRQENLTVGWGGSMFKGQDWRGIENPLAQYMNMNEFATFHTIGANYTNGIVPRTRTTGWSSVPNYYDSIDFDIGLAPLMHSEFNRFKCHTKLGEYGARHVPTIASPIGQNITWIEHGVNGWLADGPDEWLEGLLHMTNDNVREAMAEAAFTKAKEFAISQHISKYEAVYGGTK